MTIKASKYQEQADKLAKAADIAEQVVKESSDFKPDLAKPMLDFGTQVKNMALNHEPQFKKLVSLKYLDSDFFTFWNESTGPDVDKFWTGRLNQEQVIELNKYIGKFERIKSGK